MKSIKFTDEELEHLKSYYEMELAEAEKDVARIKDIMSKFGERKPFITESPVEIAPAKRGPGLEEKSMDGIKKGRKPRADKGHARGKRGAAANAELADPGVVLSVVESLKDKPAIPKKSPRKKKQYRKYGITLTPLSKPLPRRAPEPELPPAEQLPENTE